tara:strand:+ start:11 stop:550 length:540 start_codon:yes stop_codon:yes gene_type:complete
MKVEYLKLLAAKSMSLEPSSKNHDAVLPEDIAHYLGTKNLTSIEYDLLIAKYTENSYSRAMVADEIFEDACEIFFKNVNIKDIERKRFLIRNFISLALREIIETACPICGGKGFIAELDRIVKCVHCDNSGNFIYDDNNRSELMGFTKKDYSKYKKAYDNLLEKLQNIEISALSKIGDI